MNRPVPGSANCTQMISHTVYRTSGTTRRREFHGGRHKRMVIKVLGE